MSELGRALEREMDLIAPPAISLDGVDRARRRRRRNQRIGSAAIAIAVAAAGAGLVARALAARDVEPAGPPAERLVFVSPGFGDEEDRLFTAATDGSDIRQVADIHAEYPEWSPDGSTIAFDDGRNLTGSPETSPNGTVFLVDADGSDLRTIDADAAAFAPSWSADGSRLAVAAEQPGLGAGISWLEVATGELTPVTTNPYPGYWDHEPDVSPDGTRIAFVRIRDLAGERPLAALFVVGADGSGLQRLTSWETDAGTPDWSPDGTRIAFNNDDRFGPGPLPNIQVIEANGSDQQTVVDPGPNIAAFWPTWSPDGAAIVFTRFDTRFIEPSRLSITGANGGGVEPFLTRPEANQIDWGPSR